MLTIHSERDRYFVVDSQNHFEELEFPVSQEEWRSGWERLHEGEGDFIRISGYYSFPVNPHSIFANWNEFPELHDKPVFVCHRKDSWGDDFSDIRREMGV